MNNTKPEEFHYQPGICNMDDTGVRWRKKLGSICLVAGIASLAVMYVVHFGMVSRFIIGAGFGYMPLWADASGFCRYDFFAAFFFSAHTSL